ncbi:MAG: acyl-ACP--UDP-N-acetylglucosamine O-acyltransferase [Planctomycetes bacterium]|nr:acyl-ACP--UDP-N-acetylglucosamine O-acyltransferase [Planctomycetota bacterium]
MIHPTAVVHPSAELSDDVHVGAYSVVEAGVRIEAGVFLAEHVVVRSGTHLEAGCCIDSFAAIGGKPQMRGEPKPVGGVRVGARTTVREGVTISCPTNAEGHTVVGADCMLMANSHVGHDCEIGDEVTLANNVMLAGHVMVGAGTFLGGGAGVHQFVRIGGRAMVGGNASISYDVPPFAMAAERNQIRGLNFVGLRRSKTPAEVLQDLKRAYHAVYSGPGDFRKRACDALAARACGVEAAGREFLEFFVGGKRGFARPPSC